MIDSQAINCAQENGVLIVLISGLVSVFVSLIVYFIKEQTKTKRDKKEYNKQLVENYIDPLIDAIENLHIRLEEIIEYDCLYFGNDIKENVYLDYKRKSTMYRLCAVFGQIYLLKHEKRFTILSRIYKDLDMQIESFRTVLADGSWLDTCNTKEVLELLDVSHFNNKSIPSLSVKIENLIFRTIKSADKTKLLSMSDECESVFFEKLCGLLEVPMPNDRNLENRIKLVLSRKGVFILRDMQDDIGITMLMLDKRDKGSMIGYSEFSEMLENEKFLRVRELFDKINFNEIRENIDLIRRDARYCTLLRLEEQVEGMLRYLQENKYCRKKKTKASKFRFSCLWHKNLNINHDENDNSESILFRNQVKSEYMEMYNIKET